jgi:hypothetical protein
VVWKAVNPAERVHVNSSLIFQNRSDAFKTNAENEASIMFEFVHPAMLGASSEGAATGGVGAEAGTGSSSSTPPVRMLFTGDGMGRDMPANYPKGRRATSPLDILKINHHGSQVKNALMNNGLENPRFDEGMVGYFETFSAKKYVISSELLSTRANPDTVCLFKFILIVLTTKVVISQEWNDGHSDSPQLTMTCRLGDAPRCSPRPPETDKDRSQ